MQVGYLLTFSTEGNTVGKMVGRLGDVGRLIELGRAIRITYRIDVKSAFIRAYHCVIHYKS